MYVNLDYSISISTFNMIEKKTRRGKHDHIQELSSKTFMTYETGHAIPI